MCEDKENIIIKAESESKALRELARVDALKAKAMLKDFRSKYLDFPEIETLAIAVEGERSGEMKGKVADLLRSVEDLADNDPKQAREILTGLSSDDIDPIDRRALETRISNAEGKVIVSSISNMESTLSEVKSKLGGEVLQILADGKVKTDSSLSLSRQTAVAADIKLKIDQSAELPEVRASLIRLAATITSVTAMHPSTSQMSQINGIKAEVEVLRLAVK